MARDAGEMLAFRARAREWAKANLRPDEALSSASNYARRVRALQRDLFEAGLAGLSVPAEYGGRGLGPEHERIFAEEVARNGVPWRGVGTSLAMMLAHGSEALKRRHIPAMLRGEEIWVQLLSESAAGSDLAGLVTLAERVPDGYLITGEKMWISYAGFADYGSCLARSDPRAVKNRGLTMFALDLHAPGVTVLPVATITGASDFCEVFLDHAPVPADHVIGEVGSGWAVAATGRDQRNAAASLSRTDLPATITRSVLDRAGPVADTRSAGLAADAWIRHVVAGHLEERIRDGIARSALPRSATALVKLGRIWRDQANAAAALDAEGLDGVCWAPAEHGPAALEYLEGRARSVAGGTTEIQLNFVAERVLRLPREDRPDLNKPFDELASNSRPPLSRSERG